jgi:hypothetical protein
LPRKVTPFLISVNPVTTLTWNSETVNKNHGNLPVPIQDDRIIVFAHTGKKLNLFTIKHSFLFPNQFKNHLQEAVMKKFLKIFLEALYFSSSRDRPIEGIILIPLTCTLTSEYSFIKYVPKRRACKPWEQGALGRCRPIGQFNCQPWREES